MRFGYKASTALAALAGAFSGAAEAAQQFARNAATQITDYEPRVKGKNRRRQSYRKGHYQVHHEASRFARKTAKFGPMYRPGRLFKGHRV